MKNLFYREVVLLTCTATYTEVFTKGDVKKTTVAKLTRLLEDGQEVGAKSGHKSELSLNRVERSFSPSVKFSRHV